MEREAPKYGHPWSELGGLRAFKKAMVFASRPTILGDAGRDARTSVAAEQSWRVRKNTGADQR